MYARIGKRNSCSQVRMLHAHAANRSNPGLEIFVHDIVMLSVMTAIFNNIVIQSCSCMHCCAERFAKVSCRTGVWL